MEEKQLSEMIAKKIKQWETIQQGQKDGYEYERSFSEMMKSIGQDILQESIGPLPSNKKLKKNC